MIKKRKKNNSLFTLSPKNGFYHDDHAMAYLDGKLYSYYPHNVDEPLGYVSFGFYENHRTDVQQVRLWSYANQNQKLLALFTIQTHVDNEDHHFNFFAPTAYNTWKPISTVTKSGKFKGDIPVEFTCDNTGAALIKMFASKNPADYAPYTLRKIEVFTLAKKIK